MHAFPHTHNDFHGIFPQVSAVPCAAIACGDVTTDMVHGLGGSGGVCRYGARTIAPLVMLGEQGHIKRPDFSDVQGPGRPCSAPGPHTAGDRKQPDRASPKDG